MEEYILEQLNNIETEYIEKKIVQDQEKENKGKYTHIKKTIDKNGVEYSVTEYVCPNGDIGFDILFYKNINDIDYRKSVCFGAEKDGRQHEWQEVEKITV